jgi:hypothetical protein
LNTILIVVEQEPQGLDDGRLAGTAGADDAVESGRKLERGILEVAVGRS